MAFQIQVRDDIDTPWYEAPEVPENHFQTRGEARKALRDAKEIGLLLGYDAARIVEVEE